jgi:hypothetical protein
MLRVITRGLRKQLEFGAPQQLVHEMVQPQKQPHFHTKGIQPVDAPSNEP